MHAFPLLDQVCQPEVILNTLNEQMARTLHENYLENRRREGTYDPDGVASHRAWDRLDETYRQANRSLATDYFKNLDHIGYKLVTTTEWGPSKHMLSPEEMESLAEAEHQRWSDERISQGWTFGPVRDDEKRLHPNLVPWSELSEADREKDREMMREISAVLTRRGLGFAKEEANDDGLPVTGSSSDE
jgi:RyR domain